MLSAGVRCCLLCVWLNWQYDKVPPRMLKAGWIAPMQSVAESDDEMDGQMTDTTLTLHSVLKTLGSRLSCTYFLMTTDTDKRGKQDRFRVSLVSDNPNPCSMEELACSIPRSTYASVGLLRDELLTEAILSVNSSVDTFTVYDATNDDTSTSTAVPPFYSRIYGNGSISVSFYNIPSSRMDESPDTRIRIPGTAFGSSARAVVANLLSRMRWLRKQTIDNESLQVEDENHVLYGRDVFYGSDLSTPKIRLISPDDRADSNPLLPTKIEIKGVGTKTLTTALRKQAYEDLSRDEKNLYGTPAKNLTFDEMKSTLGKWKLSYDRVESFRSEWMPFRKPYDSQFSASGRATIKSNSWKSLQAVQTQSMQELRKQRIARLTQIRQPSVAPRAPRERDTRGRLEGSQPAAQAGNQTGTTGDDTGDGTSNEPGKTRVELKHVFYVALEQEVDTAADKRQLYKVEITMFGPAPFKQFERLSKNPQEATNGRPLRSLGQYLSRIPDRERSASEGDVASRNAYLMSLRNMLVLDPDVDAIDALDYLFATKTARDMLEKYSVDHVDNMAKFIERMEKARLLNTCAKIAFLVSEIGKHIGVENMAILENSFTAIYKTMIMTANLCLNFIKYISNATDRFSECRNLIKSMNAPDFFDKEETPDTDEQNVTIAVDTLRLVDRVKETKNPDAASVSPARDEDLKRVIYRAICRLQCSMDTNTNKKLDHGKYPDHPFGLYVVYPR